MVYVRVFGNGIAILAVMRIVKTQAKPGQQKFVQNWAQNWYIDDLLTFLFVFKNIEIDFDVIIFRWEIYGYGSLFNNSLITIPVFMETLNELRKAGLKVTLLIEIGYLMWGLFCN